MNLRPETWLMLLALGLYLWDSTLLLRTDEFVLLEKRRGWRPAFGASGWKLAGREPWMPNPLTPWREVVKIRWTIDELAELRPDLGSPRLPFVGAGPKLAVTALLMLVFVALPTCLFVYPVFAVTLPVVALIYLTCVIALATLRPVMEAAAFWKLCWECIACPPFCINAVRKACLRAPVRARVADVHVDDAAEVARQIGLRLREQMDVEAEGSERMARLQAVSQALAAKESA